MFSSEINHSFLGMADWKIGMGEGDLRFTNNAYIFFLALKESNTNEEERAIKGCD